MDDHRERARRAARAACRALVTGVLATTAVGQELLGEFSLPGPFGAANSAIGSARDADGDGVPDVLVGGPVGVLTISGATGALLGHVDLGDLVPLNVTSPGDLDGDGAPDVVVAAGDALTAFSRTTGTELWTVPGEPIGSIGWQLDVLSDQDGDGVCEVLAGEPDADPLGLHSGGRVHVVSGATGVALTVIDGTFFGQSFGRSTSNARDVDGDGRDDVLVGDSRHAVDGTTVGRLAVYDALDGALLLEVVNDTATPNFATTVVSSGDLDGDGFADLVATRRESSFETYLEAFSGADGSELWSVAVPLASDLAALGDVTGDGVGDVASASNFGLGLVDGATGAFTQVSGAFVAARVAALGDVDGDGRDDAGVISVGDVFGGPASVGVWSVSPAAFLFAIDNPLGATSLGRSAAVIPDVDGDGVDDFALGSEIDVVLVSGADLSQILRFEIDHVAAALAGLDDLDGDGVPDLVVGDPFTGGIPPFFPGNGRVAFYSGADGALIDQLAGASAEGLGSVVEPAGDRDGDGVGDVYVAARTAVVAGTSNAGEVRLYSGATRALLDTLHGDVQLNGDFGASLSADRDVTGDGVVDLAVGSAEESPGGFDSGTLYVFDGVTGAEVRRVTGALNGGVVVGALVGDLDGDGTSDLVSAQPTYEQPGENTPRGRVRAWSGADGAFLWQLVGDDPNGRLGNALTDAGDVNGDGLVDVAAHEVTAGAATLSIVSGVDGALLDRFETQDGASGFSAQVVSGGLFDAGGCSDVLVTVPSLDDNGGARVYASSQGGVHGFVDVGAAKAGSNGLTPRLQFTGDLAANGLVTVAARDALPGATGVWFIGTDAAFLPFKQGTLVPSPGGAFFSIAIVTDGAGGLTLTAPNPSTVFEGFTLWHQIWFADVGVPGKVSATNGLQEIFK